MIPTAKDNGKTVLLVEDANARHLAEQILLVLARLKDLILRNCAS